VDNVLAAVMRAPQTYTGENVVEFHTHGGRVQVDEVLRVCIEAGALPALPGEFTFRAFLSGKIDLTQAEAVADLIASHTELAGKVALQHSGGMLRNRLESMREQMVETLSLCEVGIDFVEEDVPAVDGSMLANRLMEIAEAVSRLIDSYDLGKLVRDGARVVLAGAPNVGKSSIFNALLREERAIVTEIPGTTRDAVTEWLDANGIPVMLADTAGMRDSVDAVEIEGVRRSREYQERADLVIRVLDATNPDDGNDAGKVREERQRSVLALNKIDLVDARKRESLRARYPDSNLVSAVSGEGLTELWKTVRERLVGADWSGEGVVVTRRRHYEALLRCREALVQAVAAIEAVQPLELVALELRSGLGAIDELVGKVYDDEILNRIFGEFCIGK